MRAVLQVALLIGAAWAFRPRAGGRPLRVAGPVRAVADAEVFDGVVEAPDCQRLAGYLSSKSPGFAVFDRSDLSCATELERVVDSVLTRLDDDSRWVEYWHVTRWISHDVHRDVDEKSCFEKNQELHPRNGHVLYLSLDQSVADSGGHTIVLAEDKSKLFICPPLPGRLLRFNGSLMHGVPRPALEYFLNAQAGEELVALPVLKSLPQDWPSIQHCLATDHSSPLSRVVLLFNTWPEAPPLDSPVARDEDRQVQALALSELRSSPRDWEKKPVAILPETLVNEPGGGDVAGLRMVIGLPADRRRRDTYASSLKLLAGRGAPEALVIRPAVANPPRVITVAPERGDEDDE